MSTGEAAPPPEGSSTTPSGSTWSDDAGRANAETSGRPGDAPVVRWRNTRRANAELTSTGVWTGAEQEPPEQKPVIVDPLRAQQRKHVADMQKWVLIGIGGVFVLTFVAVVLLGWFKPEENDGFSLELARMIIPAVLGSGATVVGVLFVSERRTSGHNDDNR